MFLWPSSKEGKKICHLESGKYINVERQTYSTLYIDQREIAFSSIKNHIWVKLFLSRRGTRWCVDTIIIIRKIYSVTCFFCFLVKLSSPYCSLILYCCEKEFSKLSILRIKYFIKPNVQTHGMEAANLVELDLNHLI